MNIKGGKFLITGGASLIGSHLAEQLLGGGADSVTLFDNYSLGTPETISFLVNNPKVKIVRGDILRANELYDAFDGMDGVFAVAAFLTLPMSQNPALGLDVNVRGMQNVLEACRYRGVKKVVFCSSVAVYGESPEPGISEDRPLSWQQLQPAGVLYAASKVIGENLCRYYKQRHKLDYVALRYSTVYGERQHYRGVNALYIVEAYDEIIAGKAPVLPGDGTEVHDYVYVGDVARANIMAMQSDVSGESFNIVSGVDTSLNQIVDILLRITGSKLKPIYRDDPTRVRFTTATKIEYRREKAKQLLGWEPQVSVAEGVGRLVAWLSQQSRAA